MPKCSHCKTDFKSKSEFRIPNTSRYSPHCTMCRGIAIIKSEDGNCARKYTDKEKKLVKRFLNKMSAKEKREKLPISKGKFTLE